jgi:dipeptidyl-peptidase-4
VGNESSFISQLASSGRFRNGAPRSFAVTENGVYFLQSAGPTDSVLQLKHIYLQTGEINIIFNPANVEITSDLPEAEKARRERLRESGSGITAFSVSDSGATITFALNGTLFLVQMNPELRIDIAQYSDVFDPQLSADGSTIACVRNGSVWVIPTAALERGYQITPTDENTWGLADFLSAEEFGRSSGFWFSPDGTQLLVQYSNDSMVKDIALADLAQPTKPVTNYKYSFAGTANPKIGLRVFSATTGSQALSWDTESFPYLSQAGWSDNNSIFAVVLDRSQKQLHHLKFDLSMGASITDMVQQQTWVESSPKLHRAHQQTRWDIRDDFEANQRRLFRNGLPVTEPDFYVRSIGYSNAELALVEATKDSAFNQILQVSQEGVTELTPLNKYCNLLAANDSVRVIMATDFEQEPEYFVVTPEQQFSIPDLSYVPHVSINLNRLPNTSTNRTVVLLPKEISAPLPVIMSPYGGPHAQLVLASKRKYALDQWFADQGFAVIVSDGLGSPGVNTHWEHAITKNFLVSLDCQIAALEQAVKTLPGVLDVDRVGIRGWSFGGYLSALATMTHPEIFKVAVAGAPVTEWRLYDSAYTERYLGNPETDPETYDRNSLLTLTPSKIGKLLIVHGLADDNVLAAHSLQLSAHLINLGLQHQFLPLSNVTHMTPQVSVTETLLKTELSMFQQL